MVWNKALPDGDVDIALGDDAIRNNNDALEIAVNTEHVLVTSGVQTGRHKFDIGTNASRSADHVDGALHYSTDERAGQAVIQTKDASVWGNLDVNPLDASGNPTLPRVNAQSEFTVCQFAQWIEITLSGADVPIDFAGSPMQWVTITGNTVVLQPANIVAGHGAVITLILIMDGSGPYTVGWHADYRAPGSFVIVDKSANGRTMLNLTVDKDGNTVVTSVADYNGTGVTS